MNHLIHALWFIFIQFYLRSIECIHAKKGLLAINRNWVVPIERWIIQYLIFSRNHTNKKFMFNTYINKKSFLDFQWNKSYLLEIMYFYEIYTFMRAEVVKDGPVRSWNIWPGQACQVPDYNQIGSRAARSGPSQAACFIPDLGVPIWAQPGPQ